MEEERWMQVCEKVDTSAISGWRFETHDKATIRDYFECDCDKLDWLDSLGEEEEVLLTVYVYPERRGAEFAVGVWAMSGEDVGLGYDNRVYEDDDYDGVVSWLEKQAESSEEGEAQ